MALSRITSGSIASPISNISITGGSISNAVLQNRTREQALVISAAADGAIDFDVNSQQVLLYTANATSNVTLNLRGNSTTSLDSVMSSNQSITVAFSMQNGTGTFFVNQLQIDNANVTPKWQGGAPTEGTSNSTEFYIFNAIKTAPNTFNVYGSKTAFE